MSGASFINWYSRLLVAWAGQAVHEGAVGFTACGAVDGLDADRRRPEVLRPGRDRTARQSLVIGAGRSWTAESRTPTSPEPPNLVSLDRDGLRRRSCGSRRSTTGVPSPALR